MFRINFNLQSYSDFLVPTRKNEKKVGFDTGWFKSGITDLDVRTVKSFTRSCWLIQFKVSEATPAHPKLTKKKYNRRKQFESIVGNVDKKELLEFKLQDKQLSVLKNLQKKLGKKKISYMTNDWINYHEMDTHCKSHTDLWQVFVEDILAGTERILHCRDYSHVLVNFHFEKIKKNKITDINKYADKNLTAKDIKLENHVLQKILFPSIFGSVSHLLWIMSNFKEIFDKNSSDEKILYNLLKDEGNNLLFTNYILWMLLSRKYDLSFYYSVEIDN